MNTDEKIAAILRMEADTVEPSPAGFDAIRAGIAARSRRVWWVRGGLAGAVLTGATVVALVATSGSPSSLRPAPPAASETATTEPTPTESASPSPSPSVSPTVEPGVPDDQALGTIWPVTSGRELREWLADPETYPSLKTPKASALAFVRSYLGVTATMTYSDWENGKVVVSSPDEQDMFELTTLSIRGFGPDGDAPYLVTKAANPHVTIGDVTATAGVAEARGTYELVDPSFTVTLYGDGSGSAPVRLAEERATQSPPDTWAADLAFRTDLRGGSLLIVYRSMRDGSIAGASAVPVTFHETSELDMPDTFVGVLDQRLGVFSSKDGSLVRYLTERIPGGGVTDPEVSTDRKTVVYAQGAGTCAAEIRSVPLAGGASTVLVDTPEGVVSHPSRRDGAFAYARARCPDGSTHPAGEEVVLTVNRRTTTFPVNGSVVDVEVGERFLLYVVDETDGKSVLHVPDLYGELADTPIPAPSGCDWTSATWGPRDANDRETILAVTFCGEDVDGDSALYRMDADGLHRTKLDERPGQEQFGGPADYDPSRGWLIFRGFGETISWAEVWHQPGLDKSEGITYPNW